jgi:hypothetical protein
MIAFVPLFSKPTRKKAMRRLAAADRIGVRMAFGCDVVVDLPANKLPT